MTSAIGARPDLRELIGRSRRRLGERDFWLVQLGVGVVTVVHALIELNDPGHELSGLFQAIHHIPVIAFLIPVSYAGLRYGIEGGLLTGLLVMVISVPNMVIIHRRGYAWLGEAMAVVFVAAIGIVLSFVVDKERRAAMSVEAQARRLAMLSRVSLAIGRSSSPSEMVRTVVDEVVRGTNALSVRFVWSDRNTPDVVGGVGGAWEESDELSAPVVSEDHEHGSLHVVAAGPGVDADQVELVRGVAAELAVALDNARLTELQRDRRRQYLHGVTRAQEEERRRIARELHDNAQSLVLLSRMLEELSEEDGMPATALERVEALREMSLGMLEEMRGASRDLRPPALDDLGLVPALEWVVGRHAPFTTFDVTLSVAGVPRRLRDDLELAAFRITQEALTNAAKHAAPTAVEVHVRFGEREFALAVVDDGLGFDSSENRMGLGLLGMRERARQVGGALTVSSGPDGTIVRFSSPTAF